MTQPCPICRAPVDVDDSKLTPEGVKVTCGLCDETFVVRSPGSGGTSSAAVPNAPSSGKTSATPSSPSAGSASRKLLEEDAEGAAPRVLVAHDSHAFGDLVRGLLEEEGFDVEVVHDGEAAQKVIADRPPLVAILEAGLPKKFGFQLCADFRAQVDPPSVRFLLVASIYDRKRFAKQPELAGAPDDFVEPRNLEIELLPKVRRLLRGRGDQTGSRPAVTTARRVDPPPAAPPAPPVTAPAIARPATEPSISRAEADRPSVSRPTVDQDEFKDLFEDSDSGSPASNAPPARTDPPSPEFALRDVDDVLRTDSGPAVQVQASSSAARASSSDDEDDLLRSVLSDDSDSGFGVPKEPDTEADPEPSDEEDERPSSSGSSGDSADDDELLRTLMQMASSEGVEPSKPMLEDDEVLPEGSEDKPVKRVEPDEDSLLGGILESDGDSSSLGIPRDEPRDEPTGRAPGDGPLELPSISASVPPAWRTDDEDKQLAAKTDDDELSKLLGGDTGSIAARERDAMPDETEKKPGSGPKRDPEPPESDWEEPVIKASDFELDGPAPARREPSDAPKSNGSSSSGFELGGDDELKAALESSELGSTSPSKQEKEKDGGGVLPGAGSTAGTPTVLKGPAARRDADDLGPSPATAADGGNSFSATESIGGDGDDDEKSLAEAKVPMDDELDRLLGGGSQPRAPENVATKPGMGPRPLPADELAAPKSVPKPANDEHEKARRLAKLIVGDILLYNADRISDAVKSGTFFEIMKGDIKDGRDFYDEKVPEDVRRERDYIQEVLEETLERKRKELGLA